MKAKEQERAAPNQALQATATSRSVHSAVGMRSPWLQSQARLPVAVPELGR